LVFDRTLRGLRNTVLLPAGWEVTAVSQSGTIGTYQDRAFVALINLNAENSYKVTIHARKSASGRSSSDPRSAFARGSSELRSASARGSSELRRDGRDGRALPIFDLWEHGRPAFGIYAPNENPGPRGGGPRKAVYTRAGAETLAANPLYDFVFLNLEGAYDANAIKAMADGLRASTSAGRKALIVRIPSIDSEGSAVTKRRVKEALDLGADGVTIPHVTGVEQATEAIAFFQDAKATVWSSANPRGDKIAMLMLEDPAAVAQARKVADLKGYSILACGIGSLAQAMGGDRAGAETGTQQVLAEAKRARLVDMLTFNAQDAEKRVKEGFLALLTQGPNADEAIKAGRAAAGR
jgi:2-keto-3-deoxy-L-rhamnonate aldolase RhmA